MQTHPQLLPAAAADFKSADTEVPRVSRLVGISGYGSFMPDDNRRIRPVSPGGGGGGGGDDGPSTPKVEKPNTDDILKKMRKVDPEQAKRYRQRTGE
ncbi:MAG: ubiquitin-like protein UBact [Verrucomicrobiota bacterium]